MGSPRLSPKKIESIRILFMRGIAHRSIAEASGCSVQSIPKLAKRHGWVRPIVSVLPVPLTPHSLGQNGAPNEAKAWMGDMLADCRDRLVALRATPCYAVDEHHRAAQALKLLDDIGRRALGMDQGQGSVKFTLQVLQTAQPKPIKAQVVDAEIVDGKSSESVEIEHKDDEKPHPS